MKKAFLSAAKKWSALGIWFGLALVILAACGGPQESIPLAHPLSSRLTYLSGEEIFISAAPGVPLSYLCDLTGFGDLRPGMTAEEVRQLHGPPTSKYQERRGRSTVYVFSTGEGAIVEVVRQMVGSEEPLIERWILRHSVSGRSLEQIVASEVLAAIPLSQREFLLHLNSGPTAARLEFAAGRPHRLWWLSDDDADRSMGSQY